MPTKNITGKRERLAALARLLHGKAEGHTSLPINWRFDRILEWRTRRGFALRKPTHDCETVGCAIGQYFSSTLIHPETRKRWQPLINVWACAYSDATVGPTDLQKLQEEVQQEFGLRSDEFQFLFMPCDVGGGWLTPDAEPHEVAWLIWFFLHSGQLLDREYADQQMIMEGSVPMERRADINDPWMEWWGRPADVMLRELKYLP